MNIRRLFCWCTFGLIHWSGRSDGGGMGDAIKCDVCGTDRYGLGAIVHDKADHPNWDDRITASMLVIVLWAVILFIVIFGLTVLGIRIK